MDRSRFTDGLSGRLVRIHQPVTDWAFVPDPLPPQWDPDVDTLRLLADAAQELGRLDGAGRLGGNPDLLLRPLRRREALKSSSLEGTYATTEELLLFELTHSAREESLDAVREVHNYAAALELGIELLQTMPFCLRLVRRMHERLLSGVRGTQKRPGEFRSTQVHIGSDRRFVPAPPGELQGALDAFERAMNARPERLPPLIWCYLLHYQFECIHPFGDGNGRVGRLLLSLMVSSECGLAKPWLYMSPWFERYKDEYVDRMFRVSTHGDWKSWIAFCLRGTIEQARDAVARLDGLIALRQDYVKRAARSGGSARLVDIVEGLFAISPAVTIPTIRDFLGVTYPTAKADLERLVELGILTAHDDLHPKTYVAWGIVRIGIDAEGGEDFTPPSDPTA